MDKYKPLVDINKCLAALQALDDPFPHSLINPHCLPEFAKRTTTHASALLYLQLVNGLQKKFEFRSGRDYLDGLDQFLVGHYQNRARNTIHFSQSAFKCALWLSDPGCDPWAKLPKFMALKATVKSGEHGVWNTSSKKIKWCSAEMLEQLIFAICLGKFDKKYQLICVLTIEGLSLLGARPCELSGAKFSWDGPGSSAQVTLKNAKGGNGRTHGPTRTLLLDDYAPSALYTLKALFSELPAAIALAGGIDKLLRKIGSMIRQANGRVDGIPSGRSLTLYSLRHQMAANLRRAAVPLEEVAALLGHATDETSTCHYAKLQRGDGRSVLPKAKQEEVARVRKVFKPFVAQAKGPTKTPPSPKGSFGMGM